MLECSRLLLLPWTDGGRGPRRILDPATGEEIGTVRWRRRGLAWWRCLVTPPVLEVREADDEPLLCTLHRFWGWGPVWQVREADGHRVALVSRREVRNRVDRRLALLCEVPDRDELEMQGQDGRPLAVLTRSEQGDGLQFAPLVEGNPFVKMALLAVALTRDLP